MGIKKKHVPGCDCCNVTCQIAVTSQVTNELVGDWTFTAGTPDKWSISGTDDAFIYTTAGSRSGVPWRVIATFKWTPDGNGDSQFYLIGGATDDENYCWTQCYITKVGALYYLHISIGQTIAGTPTQLAENAYDPTQHPEAAISFFGNPYAEFDVTLCWDEYGVLTGSASGSSLTGEISSPGVTPAGGLAGCATGVLNGDLEFYDFDFDHMHNSGSASACSRCDESCCGSAVPAAITVEIADASPATYDCNHVCPGCELFDCGQILGSFELSLDPALGDSSCFWGLEIGGEVTFPSPPLTESITIGFNLEVGSYDSTTGNRTVTLTVFESGGRLCDLSLIAHFTATTDQVCSEWTDWINMTAVDSGLACHSGGGLTARFKKV